MGRTEAGQLADVAELAACHGVLWHHCRDSRCCDGDPGLPDLVLVGPGGVLFPELKSSPRGMTAAQTGWRWALRAAGAATPLWLPSDFRNGTVERYIAALAGQRQ